MSMITILIYFLFISAITIGVRILGPALGFIVGSYCSSIYADLSVDTKIDTADPRWVGAWWLGEYINVIQNWYVSVFFNKTDLDKN